MKNLNQFALAIFLLCSISTTLLAQNTNPGGCNYYYESPQSFTAVISQASDDARENLASGATNPLGNYLPSSNTAGTAFYIWGFRFTNVNIPSNAIIESAHITFTGNIVTSGTGAATIQAEDSANPTTFTTAAYDITSRPTTPSTVNWNIPVWGNWTAIGDITTTSDISVLINELVATGWVPGNAMSFLVDASIGDQRAVYSYDQIAATNANQSNTATLTINYTLPTPSCSGISGFVFEDKDDNGIFENDATNDDYGIMGVGVFIYDDNGLVYSTTTNGQGNWSFPTAVTGTTYRVEYVYNSDYVPARASNLQSSTETAYATAPQCCIDFGLHQRNNFGCDQAQFVTVCNVKCVDDGSTPVLVSLTDDEKSDSLTDLTTYTDGTHPVEVPVQDLGSTWGLAYNKSDDVIYVGAKFMQSSNVGPNGFGAIYCVDNSSNDPNVDGSVNGSHVSLLTTVANPGTAPSANWGTCVTTGQTTAQINEMMQKAARVGLGDVDINSDNDVIYTINLNTRELVEVPVDGCTPSGTTNTFSIPTPTSGHDCTGDLIAPFGLKYYQGKVYIGAVCTAENTQNQSNLWAYVFTYTPGSGAIDPNPVVDFPLDYLRGNNGKTHPDDTYKSMDWQPWRNVWDAANPIPVEFYGYVNQQLAFPQPILSDIEFYNGNIILGFIDRFGEQFSHAPDPSGVAGTLYTNNTISSLPMGDLLVAGNNGNGTWTLESNGGINSTTTGACQTVGNNNLQGPGNGEFYYSDRYSGHTDMLIGGIAQLPGNNDILATAYDPTSIYMDATGDARWGSGGAVWLDNKDGSMDYAWEGYWGSGVFYGKGNGFGDIEYICDCPPIQIGNRIWFDSDEDGVQDPSEAPIGGVIVHLYDAAGNGIATTTTDSDGRYYFGDTNVPGGLVELTSYFIGLNSSQFSSGNLTVNGTPYGPLTSTNSSPIGQVDTNDNDATYPSTSPSGVTAIDNPNLPYIPVTTDVYGANDFTLDIGFTPPCPATQCGGIGVVKN